MTTPCIVATGTREDWRGVPCKADGYESWTGAYIVDRIVRIGIEPAARELVDVPHGWTCVGGAQLTEADDFLGGDSITHEIDQDMLAQHYAVYVIDVAHQRLEVRVDDRWLDAAEFAPLVLPSWYPQLGARTFGKRRRPEAITRALQSYCRAQDLDWGSTCEALRRWLVAPLGDLAGCSWLYLGGQSDEHVRCLIGDTFLYAAINSHDRIATASDGTQRAFDVDAMPLLEQQFRELGLSPTRTIDVVRTWFTTVVRNEHPAAEVHWYAGTKRWDIETTPVRVDPKPYYLMPDGFLPTLLCWLF